jgi:hypothetical protein
LKINTKPDFFDDENDNYWFEGDEDSETETEPESELMTLADQLELPPVPKTMEEALAILKFMELII